MRQLLLGFFLSTALVACQSTPQPQFIVNATQAQALRQQNLQLQLLDVRTAAEHNDGFIKGAQNLDFNASDFEKRLQTLDKQAPYLLYCASGRRSAQARQLMLDQGFTQVYDLEGGFQAWQSANLPIEKP